MTGSALNPAPESYPSPATTAGNFRIADKPETTSEKIELHQLRAQAAAKCFVTMERLCHSGFSCRKPIVP